MHAACIRVFATATSFKKKGGAGPGPAVVPAERAWFLRTNSGYMQRWHARCIASSDFAAIRGKRRSVHDRHSCACGAPVEDTQHVHLHCPLYANIRQPFFALLGAAVPSTGHMYKCNKGGNFVRTGRDYVGGLLRGLPYRPNVTTSGGD